MHVYFIKRPERDQWEPCSLLVGCLVAAGLRRAPHIWGEWAVKVEFVRDLSEHALQVVS